MKTLSNKFFKRTVRKYFKYSYSTFNQPVLTNDGFVGGYDFSVSLDIVRSTGYAYKAFDDSTSTYAQSTGVPFNYIIYNPDPLNITQIDFLWYSGFGGKNEKISGSDDGINWTMIKEYVNSSASSQTLSLSNNTDYYKYYQIYVSSGLSSTNIALYNMTLTATVRKVISGTSEDYDFYIDVDEYRAFI